MATKEQMEKVKDIVVKLRYLECMDNIMKGKSEHT